MSFCAVLIDQIKLILSKISDFTPRKQLFLHFFDDSLRFLLTHHSFANEINFYSKLSAACCFLLNFFNFLCSFGDSNKFEVENKKEMCRFADTSPNQI